MYIQITDHCNMACAHCGFSCGPRKKRFMTMQNFRRAVDMDSDSIAIGGGEPTLHPMFWEMLGYALGHSGCVWMATNGSQTDTAITLAGMAERGVIGCALSLDFYHEEISNSVIKAFKNNSYGIPEINDRREIRDVSRSIKRAGRAIKTQVYTEEDGCVCDGMMVDPDGVLFSCGCKKLVVGDLQTGYNRAGKFLYDYDYRTKLIDSNYGFPFSEEELDDIYITECLFTGSKIKDKKILVKYIRSMGV